MINLNFILGKSDSLSNQISFQGATVFSSISSCSVCIPVPCGAAGLSVQLHSPEEYAVS